MVAFPPRKGEGDAASSWEKEHKREKQMRLNDHKNTQADYKRSRRLRNEASTIERKLWKVLSEQAVVRGLKFRRQQVIHPYIADFACMAAKVLIEIDGDSHAGREEYDFAREQFLGREGYTVLRFSNQDVVENTLGVVETILNLTAEACKKG